MGFVETLLSYDYMQRAVITSLVVGIASGIIGTLTVLRGASLIGDAISHAVLPGIAASAALGFGFFPGALLAGLLTATAISYLSSKTRIRNDAVIGIVFTAMFSLGVIIISIKPSSTDLTKILFGNVLAVNKTDMVITMVVALLVVLAVVLLFKELLLSTLDPLISKTYGVSPVVMHYVLMGLLTLVTVASLQAVGVILVVALLITPAAAAFLISKSMGQMMVIAACIGAVSSFFGLVVSFYLNVPSGPAIVLVATFIFGLVFAITKNLQRVRSSTRLAVTTGPIKVVPHEN